MADKKPKIRVIETRDGMRMPALGIGTWRMGERAGQKKNEIAAVDARVNELVRKIRSKVETREFFCEAELDFELKIKRWKDVKTGEIRKTEELSAHDYQMKLRLEEGVDNESNDDNDDDGIWPEKEEILDETDGVVADETVSDPV